MKTILGSFTPYEKFTMVKIDTHKKITEILQSNYINAILKNNQDNILNMMAL